MRTNMRQLVYLNFYIVNKNFQIVLGSSLLNWTAKGQQIARNSNAAEKVTQLDDQSTNALVAHQKIGAIADQGHGHSMVCSPL